MTDRLLLVSSDTALIQTVKSAMQAVASFLQVDGLGDQATRLGSQFQPTAIIIDSDARSGVRTTFERIAEAKRQFPSLPVIAMGNEMSAQLVLAAFRAGANDFIDREAPPHQIHQSIEACLAHRGKPVHSGRAQLLGVLSGLPDACDQDFSLNLAVRAARNAPKNLTLYIDMSLPVSQADIALGLKMKFSLADAVRELKRLDRALLESALARDPATGLYVMPLSRDFSAQQAGLEAESFGALLHMLRSIFDVIVIGYGPFSRQRALLEMAPAAGLFLCCNQRFASIRAASDLRSWLAECEIKASPIVVVHEMAPDMIPAPSDVTKALQAHHSVIIRGSWDSFAAQLNQGKPAALAASSRYARALDECLALAGLGAPQPAKTRSLVREWLALAPAGIS